MINFLLDELAENGSRVDPDVRDAARILERYYAPTRYPDALGGISPNRIYTAADAADAIARARVVLAFAARISADESF